MCVCAPRGLNWPACSWFVLLLDLIGVVRLTGGGGGSLSAPERCNHNSCLFFSVIKKKSCMYEEFQNAIA